jgi:hypothetical protein
MVRRAVENNARWCDLVCRSHGITTSWQEGFWVSRQPSPRFYPEAITLQRSLAPAQVIEELPSGICSVKDSFADLELESHGFEPLFDARWIYRAFTDGAPPATGWTTVSTDREFVRWLEACGLAGVLPPVLLRDESVRFLQREHAHEVSAGFVLNRSGSVVGVSNLFTTNAPLDQVWCDVAALCGQQFGVCSIVGYERDQGLDAAINAGFDDLAALRIWLQVR